MFEEAYVRFHFGFKMKYLLATEYPLYRSCCFDEFVSNNFLEFASSNKDTLRNFYLRCFIASSFTSTVLENAIWIQLLIQVLHCCIAQVETSSFTSENNEILDEVIR
jgi:hypothetical protein